MSFVCSRPTWTRTPASTTSCTGARRVTSRTLTSLARGRCAPTGCGRVTRRAAGRARRCTAICWGAPRDVTHADVARAAAPLPADVTRALPAGPGETRGERASRRRPHRSYFVFVIFTSCLVATRYIQVYGCKKNESKHKAALLCRFVLCGWCFVINLKPNILRILKHCIVEVPILRCLFIRVLLRLCYSKKT